MEEKNANRIANALMGHLNDWDSSDYYETYTALIKNLEAENWKEAEKVIEERFGEGNFADKTHSIYLLGEFKKNWLECHNKAQ